MSQITNETIYVVQCFGIKCWGQTEKCWHDVYNYSNLKTENEANKWCKKLTRQAKVDKHYKGNEYRIVKREINKVVTVTDIIIE